MAVPVLQKRTATPGKVPAVGDMQLGQLVVNTYDGKLYLKRNVSGVESVVLIGGGEGYFQRYDRTATAGQTAFPADYVPGALIVLLNGRTLQPADYTATSGSSVTVPTAATGDSVTIIAFSTFEVANTYTKAEVDALLSAAGAPILTKQFISSEQAFTAGGALTLAHGLGVKPKLVTGSLICQVAELGYSVGEEIDYPHFGTDAGSGTGLSIVASATQLAVRMGQVNLVILRKDTGSTEYFTPARWRLIVRAFA